MKKEPLSFKWAMGLLLMTMACAIAAPVMTWHVEMLKRAGSLLWLTWDGWHDLDIMIAVCCGVGATATFFAAIATRVGL